MIDEKKFKQCITVLCEVYNFPAPSSMWMSVTKRVLDKAGLTDEDMSLATERFVTTQTQGSVYKMPGAADIISFSLFEGKKIEDYAKQEANRVFYEIPQENSSGSVHVFIQDKRTAWVVQNTLGGVAGVRDIQRNHFEKISWKMKEFVDSYMYAHENRKESSNHLFDCSQMEIIGEFIKEGQEQSQSKALICISGKEIDTEFKKQEAREIAKAIYEDYLERVAKQKKEALKAKLKFNASKYAQVTDLYGKEYATHLYEEMLSLLGGDAAKVESLINKEIEKRNQENV